MNNLNIGVLSIQGDIHENILAVKNSLQKLDYGGTVYGVNKKHQIHDLDCLLIPGGESTTISKLSMFDDLFKEIHDKINLGMPVFGICAGLILLSKHVSDKNLGKTNQINMGLLDVEVERNYFGRQQFSFEHCIEIKLHKLTKIKGVFIRAPNIKKVGTNVQILSRLNNSIVAVQQNNILATSFHPELTSDTRLYEYFFSILKK